MRKRKFLPAVSLALIALLLAPAAAEALTGAITHLSGAVMARGASGQSRILSVKSEVQEGDVIVTADNAYVRIKFADGAETVLRPNTQLKIDAYKYEEQSPQTDNAVLSLIKGGLRTVTGLLGRRTPGGYRVTTATATVGIRGTHFGARVCNNDCADVPSAAGGTPANGLHVDVADGIITLTTAVGTIEVKVGEFGYVQSLSVVPVLVPPGQGTPVTLPRAALNPNIQGGTVGKVSQLECTFSR